MDVDSASRALCAAEPKPEGIFPRAKWMGEAADSCAALAKQYRSEADALITKIRYEGLSSDAYEVVEVCRPYSWVDMEFLRRKEPEVFARAVHVKQAFAEKTLGRRRLYELVAESLGDEVKEHEFVSVSDVRRMLPAGVASLYVIEGEEFVRYEVVEKEVMEK